MIERYQQTLADRHYNKLAAEEITNFRKYPDRGYSVNRKLGVVYHGSGNHYTIVGEILKNGMVVWLFDKKICGYIMEDGSFHFCKALSGLQYGKRG